MQYSLRQPPNSNIAEIVVKLPSSLLPRLGLAQPFAKWLRRSYSFLLVFWFVFFGFCFFYIFPSIFDHNSVNLLTECDLQSTQIK